MKITHVIFDFDGTIVDSAPAIISCFRDTLAWRNIEPEAPLDSALIGPPLLETMARISGINNKDELLLLSENFKKRYDEIAASMTMVYEGVVPILDTLKHSGFQLHIATNKRLAPTQQIIVRRELGQYFDSIYAIDSKSPPYLNKSVMLAALLSNFDIEPSTACYVGDRIEDAEAADANALDFLATLWGYGDWESYPVMPHWKMIFTPDQIVESLGIVGS